MTVSHRARSDPPSPAHRRARTNRRRLVTTLVVGLLVVPTVSYAQALTYPGEASVSERTVDWIRDHGGGGVVDLVENWWFSRGPAGSAPDPAALPAPVGVPSFAGTGPVSLAVLTGAPPVAGEGVWVAGPGATTSTPVLHTTFVRPDPRYPGVVAGVARIDTSLVRVRSVAGTRQPVDDPTAPARVPADLLPSIVATFNSGFKMDGARGGFYADGRAVVPLRDGAASLVIRRDGTATVGQWGRDVTAGPDVVSVRQNLDLVVDHARPVDGLDRNADGTWGSAKNQLQFTWRSGVGVDADGNLIYVGGNGLTLETLGTALATAGVVTGMELDIHTDKVDFAMYRHGTAGSLQGSRLLPDMPGAGDRYLQRDQRDFFVVSLR